MILIATLVAVLTSALSLVALIPLLRRVNMLDTPNHRSLHDSVIPRGGGVGVLLGMACGAVLEGISGDLRFGYVGWGAVVVVVVLGVVGLLDDLGDISALTRLGAQVSMGIAMDVMTFAGSHKSTALLFVVGAVGVIWLTAYVNAFNFMDGVNGVAAISAIIAGVWYAWVGTRFGDSFLTVSGLLLAGACLGFLPWNAPRARVFLGDVGSYGIGALIAMQAWVVAIRHEAPVTALAPLSVYLADTSFTLFRRFRSGARLMESHREHVYQRVVASGIPHLGSTAIVVTFAGAVCACVRWLPLAASVPIAAVILGFYLAVPLMRRVEVEAE